ncbi:MAG: hypothetical protein LBT14_09655 [Treponema sp.]|jgi:hypothetical protein|nr:hypothetical protein [Treponema sp.]
MIQFYFMSILFNGVTGYILMHGHTQGEEGGGSGFRAPFPDDTSRLVLGVLTVLTGLLKLLSAMQGDLPVIGDLIPATAGLAGGFVLIFEYYRKKTTIDSNTYRQIEEFLNFNKKWIGFLVFVAAALHFLFPQSLLL